MQRSISIRLVAFTATFAFAAEPSLFAQPVSVSLENGVHVRAPFTSVDWAAGYCRHRRRRRRLTPGAQVFVGPFSGN